MREGFATRWAAVGAELKKEGLDLAYITGSELDRSDGGWLVGTYYPQIERYGAFIGQKGTPVVVAGAEGGHVIEELTEGSGSKVALFRPFQISASFSSYFSLQEKYQKNHAFRRRRGMRLILGQES